MEKHLPRWLTSAHKEFFFITQLRYSKLCVTLVCSQRYIGTYIPVSLICENTKEPGHTQMSARKAWHVMLLGLITSGNLCLVAIY
jgi:hypothetical protein